MLRRLLLPLKRQRLNNSGNHLKCLNNEKPDTQCAGLFFFLWRRLSVIWRHLSAMKYFVMPLGHFLSKSKLLLSTVPTLDTVVLLTAEP